MRTHATTPSFIIELELSPDPGQAARLAHHLEAARALYNALMGEAMKRLRRLRADPDWQQARCLPRSHTKERAAAFAAVRRRHGFSEYALHEAAKALRCCWIAEHIDSTMAQTLASRAYQAANRVALGQARHVRFKSRWRGLDSVEGKRNDTGMRFVLQAPHEGNEGFLLWNGDRIVARIPWHNEVITHGLRQRIKYCRLVRRNASSARARGADATGKRYNLQLVMEGTPLRKPKHATGTGAVGIDLGPSTIAIVPQDGPARLLPLCAELAPDARAQRRLQRHLLKRVVRGQNPRLFWSARRRGVSALILVQLLP